MHVQAYYSFKYFQIARQQLRRRFQNTKSAAFHEGRSATHDVSRPFSSFVPRLSLTRISLSKKTLKSSIRKNQETHPWKS